MLNIVLTFFKLPPQPLVHHPSKFGFVRDQCSLPVLSSIHVHVRPLLNFLFFFPLVFTLIKYAIICQYFGLLDLVLDLSLRLMAKAVS